MTDYIITEDLMGVCVGAMSDGWFNEVRSHPLSKHDAEIAKKERERVLKDILMAMNDPQLAICDTGYLEHTYWVGYIKSLRGEP